ncbi:MAG TPA: hypothetical protein VMH28_07705 [Candidatus Acidoferrales bacterium]|nr:hypothetical protein [Candidatus Acidoferrales bacterium]
MNKGKSLTQTERERLADSRRKLQSIAGSLKHVDPKKIQDLPKIQECLDDAEETLKDTLGSPDREPTSRG